MNRISIDGVKEIKEDDTNLGKLGVVKNLIIQTEKGDIWISLYSDKKVKIKRW